MNREIKFRAWDSIGVKFIYPSEKATQTILEWDNSANSLKLQQYTGLKDKNGKEIYEGDWVKVNDGIGKIVFIHGAFVMDFDGEEVYALDQISRGETVCEVIGNIYENQ